MMAWSPERRSRTCTFAPVAECASKSEDAIPAVALTAFAAPQDGERALRSGFAAYLAKPVDVARLTRAVAELAARKR